MATVPATRRPPQPEADPDVSRYSLCLPASAFTLAGFRAWARSHELPNPVRVSFIGEEVYIDMSNEDPETHAEVKGEVNRVLMSLNRELRLGRFYPDGVLVSNAAAGVSNNPDGVLFTADSLRSGRVRLIPRKGEEGRYREIEGTPDWVMEVLSDRSVWKIG